MTKKNLLLGGILGVLLILAFVYNGPFEEWKNNLGKPNNFLTDLDILAINKIELKGQGENIVINKIDDTWKIDGTKDFYVEEGVMGTVLDSLRSAKDSELVLVSENPEKKTEFGTSDEDALEVGLMNGDEILAKFMVGKSGSEINSSYISQDSADDIYLIKASLRSSLGHNNWYNKNILSLDKEKISKIRFQYPSREFTVEKDAKVDDGDSKWAGTLPYKFSVDQDKLNDIVDTLSNMTAVDIPAQTFEGTGLEKNSIIVQVTGENIDSVIMIGADNGEEQYYIKRGDSDNIYLVTKEERDSLEKRISDLR